MQQIKNDFHIVQLSQGTLRYACHIHEKLNNKKKKESFPGKGKRNTSQPSLNHSHGKKRKKHDLHSHLVEVTHQFIYAVDSNS